MQQYNLRPVSELSRSPSSRSSRSPPNHHMSPPSSHLPPIQHSANGAQPPRRPISPSSLPRKPSSSLPPSHFFLLTGVRPRCLKWSGHATKKLPPASHRARSDAPLPPSTARAAALPQARIHQPIFSPPGTPILRPGWQRDYPRARRF
jgi:hypothetical protein